MSSSLPDTIWKYDAQLQVYYHAASSTYAVPQPSGEWRYVPASDFTIGESSSPTHRGVTAPDDKEEGEIEDDVGWGGLMEPEQLHSVLKGTNGQQDLADDVEPPKHILRLVVAHSSVLTPGDVAIIDAREGGVQIGRDRCDKGGTARVRLKEMEVSKTHAVVYWGDGGEWEEGWYAVDLGSTHGTYVDDKRLSEPKHSSKPGKLVHLSKLRVASTIFVVHIHPAWPCEACQLGRENEIRLDDGTPAPVPQAEVQPSTTGLAMNSKQKRENREVKRKLEMAALKESLLSNHSSANGSKEETPPHRAYVDRSASPPPVVTADPARPAVTSTFAKNMLAAQGWTPGTGLGKDRSGRAEPIQVQARSERRGLGTKVEEGDWRQRGKQRRYEDYGKV